MIFNAYNKNRHNSRLIHINNIIVMNNVCVRMFNNVRKYIKTYASEQQIQLYSLPFSKTALFAIGHSRGWFPSAKFGPNWGPP